MNTSAEREWPPEDARAFVGSERFGTILLALACDLQARYASLDFVGATGLVWDWFVRQATRDPAWFAGRPLRFASEGQLRAYVRQALWRTAANERRRERRRQRRLEPLPLSQEPAAVDPSPGQQSEVREWAEALPVPLNAIVDAIVFAERDINAVAAEMGLSVRRVAAMFEEGIERLEPLVFREANVKKRRRGRRGQDRDAILWRAAFAGLGSGTPLSCEARYQARGLSALQATLICRLVERGGDAAVVASDLNMDIGELNHTFSEALERLA